MKIGDEIFIIGIRESGVITNIRDDGRGVAIFTVRLHRASATSNGLYVARSFELCAKKD